MHNLHINIGLAPGAIFGGAPLRAAAVARVLVTAGLLVNFRVAQSNTERTLVATVTMPAWVRDHQDILTLIYSLAVVLRQEAIAWKYVRQPSFTNDLGYLTGPHAIVWGSFNPAFFIQP